MKRWQKHYNESFQVKLTLEQRETVLRSLLDLFRSGIIFYNSNDNNLKQISSSSSNENSNEDLAKAIINKTKEKTSKMSDY